MVIRDAGGGELRRGTMERSWPIRDVRVGRSWGAARVGVRRVRRRRSGVEVCILREVGG